MRILAIETSGRLGSVALLETNQAANAEPRLLMERTTAAGERTAQSLVPTVKHLLKEAAWRPADVQLICVTTGPGSFTGLRIGVVTAKTLSYAIGAPLVGLNTLAVLAAGVPPSPARLWTILDAQRKELFAACFERHSINDVHPQTEVIGIDEFLQRLAPGDVVAGPPLSALHEHLPPGVNAAPSDQWNPLAGAAGRLGALLFSRGETINPLELVPHYYRKSAAEEKAARKMNG